MSTRTTGLTTADRILGVHSTLATVTTLTVSTDLRHSMSGLHTLFLVPAITKACAAAELLPPQGHFINVADPHQSNSPSSCSADKTMMHRNTAVNRLQELTIVGNDLAGKFSPANPILRN